VSATDGSLGDSLRQRVDATLADLPPAEHKVAEYLRDHVQEIVFATAEEIGAVTETSDATVVRTAKSLGYSGLPELKRGVGLQIVGGIRPSAMLGERIERAGMETTSLLDHVFTEASERLAETRRLIREPEFVTAVDLIVGAREVVTFGIGPSAMNAQYLHLRLNRLGRKTRQIASTGFRLADDLLSVTEEDVVVLYAPGRLINDVVVLLDHLKTVGAKAVLISDSLGPRLADLVAVSLQAVRSAAGFTDEGLSALLLTDCLVLGVASRDRARSTAALELLGSLRSALTPKVEERVRRVKRRRTTEDGPTHDQPADR
jgi:DNA-binding MurR/RpiR family transcriptional regulator